MEHDSALSFHLNDQEFAFADSLELIIDSDTSQLLDFNDTGSLDNNNPDSMPVPETVCHPTLDGSFFNIDIPQFLFQGQDGHGNENALPDHATGDPLLSNDLTFEQGEMGEDVNNLDQVIEFFDGPIGVAQGEMGKNMNNFDREIEFLNGPMDSAQEEIGQNVNNLDQAIHFLNEPINLSLEGEMGQNMNILDQENTKALTVWPPMPVPFSCSCCQVLREIVHSDGTYISKLEIHGKVGIIYHGILEMKTVVDGLPVPTPRMVDFCQRSMEDVKQFLMQYCKDRKEAGFVMMQDSLLAFYSTLCVGLDLSTLEIMPPPCTETGANENCSLVAESYPIPQSKPSLSTQRKRTRRLRQSNLDSYFNLPINVASRRLGICTTAIKKICRNFGLKRWPYRKIKTVQNKIVRLEEGLRNKNEEESVRDRAQIEMLKQERERIINSLIERNQTS